MDYKVFLKRLMGYDNTSLYGYLNDEEYEKRIKHLVKIISFIERSNKYTEFKSDIEDHLLDVRRSYNSHIRKQNEFLHQKQMAQEMLEEGEFLDEPYLLVAYNFLCNEGFFIYDNYEEMYEVYKKLKKDEEKVDILRSKIDKIKDLAKRKKAEDYITKYDEDLEVFNENSIGLLYHTGSSHELAEYTVLQGNYRTAKNVVIVGNEDDWDASLKDWAEDLDFENWGDEYIESYLNSNEIYNYIEDSERENYEERIRESPSSYFETDELILTESQQETIQELENELSTLDPNEDEDRIKEIEDEIQEIKDNPEGLDEDLIDDKIDEILSDIKDEIEDNPARYLRNNGLDPDQFFDRERAVRDYLYDTNYGALTYDDSYDSFNINGTVIYVGWYNKP
jgi:hypothetical protein